MAAMRRARAACDRAGFTQEARARARYVYEVDFTISRELVDVISLACETAGEGCRVSLVFEGTEDAKSAVLDVVAKLPSVARSYKMVYREKG